MQVTRKVGVVVEPDAISACQLATHADDRQKTQAKRTTGWHQPERWLTDTPRAPMDLERCEHKWHVPEGTRNHRRQVGLRPPDHPDCPITAAFFVPLRTVGGVPHALVPEEDAIDNIPENRDRHHPNYREAGKKICTPMVGLFGGKVDRGDRNPAATAIRETREETGRLRTGRLLMPHVDEAHVLALVKKNRLFAQYMPNAKALIIFYQVPAEQRDAWDALPQKYYEEFKGNGGRPHRAVGGAEAVRDASALGALPRRKRQRVPGRAPPLSCPRVRPGAGRARSAAAASSAPLAASRCCGRGTCASWSGSRRGTRSSHDRVCQPAAAWRGGDAARQHHRGGAGGAAAPRRRLGHGSACQQGSAAGARPRSPARRQRRHPLGGRRRVSLPRPPPSTDLLEAQRKRWTEAATTPSASS